MTNWELGNDLLHSVCDKLRELSEECKESHPKYADILWNHSVSLGVHVNDLMAGPNRICPEDRNVKIIVKKDK